ncbi:MFS transporter [Pseudonocardia sp. GCM10023141]|uniref:MFS transporter n=1 Tax=Pseudonocardia sp. GCM10023141 TaxID=3252653 RepID=UPI00361DAED6
MCFGGMIASFMQTLVIPLIPSLPHLLSASPADASWVITVTLLTAAVMTPVAGRLGDLYGKRLVIVASLAVLVVGSVVVALSDTVIPAIIGRGLQGAAMGLIPVGISMMRDVLPAERVGSAIALMSATLGVGGAIGLPVSAFVAQNASWHALFWLAAGLGALGIVLVLAVVPESPVTTPGRFDVVGAIGLAIGLVSLLLAITKGSSWGWGSPATLGTAAAAVVVLLAWGVLQLRTREPLVDLRVSARRPVLFTNLASVVAGFAMFGTSLVFPQVLQAPMASGYGLGRSLLEAGLLMAPGGLMMMVMSPLSARLTRLRGPRVTLLIGLGVIACGYVLAAFITGTVVGVVVATIVISSGVGIAYAAMPALIMGAVPIGASAAANGLNSLMRSVGTSVSSAVAATVLAGMTISVGAAVLPSATGIRVVLLISAAASVVGFAVALLIPKREVQPTPASPVPAAAAVQG